MSHTSGLLPDIVKKVQTVFKKSSSWTEDIGDSPGSTACTLTGESEQMVNPYPSFPRRMVTCKTFTRKLLGIEEILSTPSTKEMTVACWQNCLLPSFLQDDEGDFGSASSY